MQTESSDSSLDLAGKESDSSLVKMPPARNSKEVPLAINELTSMKLDSLRQHLRARKLQTSGNKQTLIARLATYLTERDADSDSSPADKQDNTPGHSSSELPSTTSESESRQRDRSRHHRGSSSSNPPIPPTGRHSKPRDRQHDRLTHTDNRTSYRSRSPLSSRKHGRQRAPNRTNSRSLGRTRRSQHHSHNKRSRSSSSSGSSSTDRESSAHERGRSRRRRHHKSRAGHQKSKRRRHRRVSSSSSSNTDDSYTTTTSLASTSSSSTSTGDTRPRRKRHKKKAKRLRSGTKAKLDNLTVPCCPPLPRKYSSRIARGEYVSFDKLTIPKKHKNEPSSKQGPRHTKRKPVTGLSTWIEAWNRFMGVIVATKPKKSTRNGKISDIDNYGLPRILSGSLYPVRSSFSATSRKKQRIGMGQIQRRPLCLVLLPQACQRRFLSCQQTHHSLSPGPTSRHHHAHSHGF